VGELSGQVELFGTTTCPYTREVRERLEWDGVTFIEHDVDTDAEARARMLALTGGRRMVPVIVEDGKVHEVGWRGRGCMIDPEGPGA